MPTIGFAPDAMFPLIYAEKGFLSFDVTGKVEDETLISFKAGERYNMVPDIAEAKLTIDLKDEFEKYLAYNGLNGTIDGDRYIVYGKAAHAMQPHLGINAAFILAEFLSEHIDNKFLHFINDYLSFDHLGEKLGINHHDEEMKDFTINPGIFEYENGQFRIGINCRYPKGWDMESAKMNIHAATIKHQFEYKVVSEKPVHYVNKDDELIQKLHAAYIKYTGDTKSELMTIGGGTYGRLIKRGVAFGAVMPGRKDVAHQVDEYIHLDDLLKATAIYMEAIKSLCS